MVWIGLTVTPGVFMSHRKNEMPSCFFTLPSVRASTKIQSAYWAKVVQVFCPLMTQPSPSRSALVRSPARSEPAPGSEKPWHHQSRKSRMRGRKRAFCAGVPKV